MNIKITKDKNGMFHARVFSSPDANGKRISKRITGYTERDVRRQAEDFLEEMKRQPKAFRMTLREATEIYLEYHGNKKKPLSPATMRTYTEYTRNHFQDLMDVPIVNITEKMLQDEVYKLELTHTGKTIHNIVNFFVPCIKHSRRGFQPELDLPPVEKPSISIPDTEDLKQKIHTIQNKKLRIAVLLGAYCGMRRGEICALDLRNDVEYDKIVSVNGESHKVAIIHITKAYAKDKNKQYVLKGTKSYAGERDLFAPEWLNDILKEARDDPSFSMPLPHHVTNNFGKWARKNNVDSSFHGLRHFYASIMKAINVPDNYSKTMMGHSSEYMLKRYQEIMETKQQEINQDFLNFVEKNAPLHHKSAPPNTDKREKTRKTYKIKRKIEDLEI